MHSPTIPRVNRAIRHSPVCSHPYLENKFLLRPTLVKGSDKIGGEAQ
jgi:hypothetical protein